MRYIAIILFLFLIACANVRRPERGAILNPGDPTQVWIVDDIHHFATPAITDPNADGCMEGNGKNIYLDRTAPTEIWLHEFCHLCDLAWDDAWLARNQMPNLPPKWAHEIEDLIAERRGDESLWLTLQRRYPKWDAIQHQVIKDRLGIKSITTKLP